MNEGAEVGDERVSCCGFLSGTTRKVLNLKIGLRMVLTAQDNVVRLGQVYSKEDFSTVGLFLRRLLLLRSLD